MNQRCPGRATHGSYCAKHKPQDWRAQDRKRGTAAQRGYDSRWAKVSKLWKLAHPLCEECGRRGTIGPAQEVDHIIPLKAGGAKYNPVNLQSLCRAHHREKTFSDKNLYSSPQKTSGGADQLPYSF